MVHLDHLTSTVPYFMASILSSIAQNGWRETLRILLHHDNRIRRYSHKERPHFVHIRHGNVHQSSRKGKRQPRRSKQGVYEKGVRVSDDGRKLKIYRRVDDGFSVDRADELGKELVTEEKRVVATKDGKGKGSRRPTRRSKFEKKEEKRLKNEERRESRERRCGVRDETEEASVVDSVEITEQLSDVHIGSRVPQQERVNTHTHTLPRKTKTVRTQRTKKHKSTLQAYDNTSKAIRPTTLSPANAEGHSVSFQQPNMDKRSSENFVFGATESTIRTSEELVSEESVITAANVEQIHASRTENH
ncbi:hypothetical protein CC80DRAFT_556136 [Byssothecium circinans]|uniref:Uncharacterized protein n=1 Tax=Byssothecium circinans TaxID=147558 RepID=A0A6A5T8R7_9PLEO|nr:hypothetical protein CC80DRAFT_556136 [Byssothecium circinans]